MDDRTRARKLLERRLRPPTTFGVLLETARWKLPIAAGFFGIVVLFCLRGFPLPAAAAAGFWLGTFVRDVRTMWSVARAWRFTEAIVDWDRVERIAGGVP